MTGLVFRSLSGWALLLLAACHSPIAQSHIDAHVPDTSSFNQFLERDLKAHFQQTLAEAGKAASQVARIEHELLRNAPTQTGVALPKFYVWVRVHAENGLITEGAARVAAFDRQRFEVTTFLSKEEILAEPARVEIAFPAALNEKIMRLARLPQTRSY